MISVITPIYNGERYIEKNFESLKAQKNFGFEVIYINDGSKDNSLALLKNLKSDRFQITVIDKENGGVSTARNEGIKAARGEYVVFLDIDDTVNENYISYLSEKAESCAAELLVFNFTTNNKPMKSALVKGDEFKAIDKLKILKSFLYNKIKLTAWTLLVKKELLTDNKIYFPQGYHYGEDLYFAWKCLLKSDDIFITGKPLYNYIINETSAMSKFNEARLGVVELMEDLKEYVRKEYSAFYKEYSKYNVPKMYWSVFRLAAKQTNRRYYNALIKEKEGRKQLLPLLTYQNFIVSLSSAIFLISPGLFYLLARNI
jgi:Glycosyltransferases involved in cell wall biogenesis